MIRGIGLRGAVAVNVITMIGIGPLITIPLVLTQLHGSVALWAWVVGALIALCDGLVWAELGSMYPGSGGTYVFLREAFGRERLGRMLAFLFTWQIVLSAPFLLGTGYVGFAHYAAYLWPPLDADWRLKGLVAVTVGVVTLALLYRPIGRIARMGIALGTIAIATLIVVIAAAGTKFSAAQAIAADPHFSVAGMLAVGLGPALVITLYDYYGYGQSCTVSDEVRNPARVLPISIVLSILGVGTLYVLLQIGVLGSIPWHSLAGATPSSDPPVVADYVASTVVERAWGAWPARLATVAILVTAFASTFGNLLGYSRIPYAAARDGVFLKPFARLHSSGRFPNVSLLTIGLLALLTCFLNLPLLISLLTASLVVVQNLAQIAALFALRRRGERAPYRMWLFPVPSILAAAGWVAIFISTGPVAIAFGLASLAIGLLVYLWRARVDLKWPFVIKTAVLALILSCVALTAGRPARATTPATFDHSRIVERDGFPVFEVDDKPFFVYGAAFFYERLPQPYWEPSMLALKDMGINTLDLYVIWNWHELSDGQFDFDGHTSPRRDLRALLKLARKHGFKLIVRPGPVIRNEWRNGGYPPWLLERPEYGMSLHDLLEGRYPPTATLQNAHSDDAAAQWMANATHMRYSERWLKRAMREFEPYADLVLAVQLDDDQGAYIDNETWPAPHLTAYLNYLKSVIHDVTGPAMPVFINTYQMKVTASSPVWAMGNWYQSDAYSIGEHDRAQLEFSTGLLQTRPHQPLMLSEFQAGWLLGPDDIRPRPADPSNTLLAMTSALGMGVRGIVNFPAQDTFYPSGMEAPFANAFYAWDAALPLELSRFSRLRTNPRYQPTSRIGDFVRSFGPQLAAASPVWDAGIGYLASAYDRAPISNASPPASNADETLELQRSCRGLSLACRIVDLRYTTDADLSRLAILFLPLGPTDLPAAFAPVVRARLERYAAAGGIVVDLRRKLQASDAGEAMRKARRPRVVDFVPGAMYARSTDGTGPGFLTIPNYDDQPKVIEKVVLRIAGKAAITLKNLVVPAHDVLITPIALRLHAFDPGFPEGSELVGSDCPLSVGTRNYKRGPQPTLVIPMHQSECRVYLLLDGAARTFRSPPGRGDVIYLGNSPNSEFDLNFHPSAETCDCFTIGSIAHVPLRRDTVLTTFVEEMANIDAGAVARRRDMFLDGNPATIIENALVRVVVAPMAGARAFVFEDKARSTSVFTTVGGLRDDVTIEPPLSTSDRIAKYTHQFPAGMFNRAYRAQILETGKRAVVRFSYDAPDVVPAGAHFERTVTLEPDVRFFSVDESAIFEKASSEIPQQAVSVTSLAVGDSAHMTTQQVLVPEPEPFTADKTIKITKGNALGFYDTKTHELATIAWRPGDIDDATLLERHYSVVARLTLAAGRTARTTYGYFYADTIDAARAQLAAVAKAAQGPSAVSANTAR
jgi:amino acid transporter